MKVDRRGRHETHSLIGAHTGRQTVRRVLGDHPSVVNDDDPITRLFGLLHEVGDQHERDAGAAQPLQQAPHVAAGSRVQAGRELVEDRYLRLPINANATDSRCFCPPDNLAKNVLRASTSPSRSSKSFSSCGSE